MTFCLSLLSVFLSLSPFFTSAVNAINDSTGLGNPKLNGYTVNPLTIYKGYFQFDKSVTAHNLCFQISGYSSFSNQYYTANFIIGNANFLPQSHSGGVAGSTIRNIVEEASISSSLKDLPADSTGYNPLVENQVTVLGQLNGSDSNRTLCFGNNSQVWYPYDTSTTGNTELDSVKVSYGTITFYDSLDVARNNYLSQISSKLDTISNSINSQSNQQHADAQAQKEATDEQTQQQADQYNEQMDGMNNAQSSANTDSNAQSAQAQTKGTTLLQAVIDFFGAITSASASNCSINGDIMNGFSLGSIDLCSLSMPPAVSTIGSIISLGFLVSLSWFTATRLINTIKEFQK